MPCLVLHISLTIFFYFTELLSQQSVQQPVQQPAQQKIVPPVIPGTLPPVVPPFKAMPPMKKTFHDIKAYLSKLPVEPKEERPSPTLTGRYTAHSQFPIFNLF